MKVLGAFVYCNSILLLFGVMTIGIFVLRPDVSKDELSVITISLSCFLDIDCPTLSFSPSLTSSK